jgi:5-methylcytosine-specific restriction endonuclease McrA
MKYQNGFPIKKNCVVCGTSFIATNARNKYCGDREKHTGCAYQTWLASFRTEKAKARRRQWGKCEKRKRWERDRKKKQRLLNTPYAQNQRQLCRDYVIKNKPRIKELNKIWRKKNIERVLWKNKQRMKRLKNIKGSHTFLDWLRLKENHKNCCVKCGMSEAELAIKWIGTHFTELTEDHIIPISKGGTNDITNIQPLCISCNAKKRDKIYGKEDCRI